MKVVSFFWQFVLGHPLFWARFIGLYGMRRRERVKRRTNWWNDTAGGDNYVRKEKRRNV